MIELSQRNGLDVLRQLCADDALSYPFRLQVVDEAVRMKLITQDELDRPAPTPSRDGLDLIMQVDGSALPWWRMLARVAARRTVALNERRYGEAMRRHAAVVAARLVQERERDIRIYERCSGSEFESLVARTFRRAGYRVKEMGGAGDGGVDLHVWKAERHAIVQCKAHSRPIGPAVVRELFGTLRHSASASMAYLATTNGITKSAREWCKDKPIAVLLPDHLIRGRLDVEGPPK